MLTKCSETKLKILERKFYSSTVYGINFLTNKENICVIAIGMFYDNITNNLMKVFRV